MEMNLCDRDRNKRGDHKSDLWGISGLFLFIFVRFKQFHRKKIVNFNGIRTQIVGAEDEYTSTTRPSLGRVVNLA